MSQDLDDHHGPVPAVGAIKGSAASGSKSSAYANGGTARDASPLLSQVCEAGGLS